MTQIHPYADSVDYATERHVDVSDEVLAKLAQRSSGSLTAQLLNLGFRRPALAA